MNLSWQPSPPTSVGWYFLREQWASKKWKPYEIVRIYQDKETEVLQIKGRRVHGGVSNYGTDEYKTEWAGPISEPKESQV